MTSKDESGVSDLVAGLLEQAQQGDANAGRILLELLHISLCTGRPLRPGLRDYFATAVNRMMKGEDPSQALNLKRPRGRPRGQLDLDRVHRDEEVFALFKLRRELGDTYEEAVVKCEEVFHLSESAVRRAVDRRLRLQKHPLATLFPFTELPE